LASTFITRASSSIPRRKNGAAAEQWFFVCYDYSLWRIVFLLEFIKQSFEIFLSRAGLEQTGRTMAVAELVFATHGLPPSY
jgi:hypothetical protein